MRFEISRLAACFAFFFIGCSVHDQNYDYNRRFYCGMDPVEEAQRNFNKSDCRIYSAMGYAKYFPGLNPAVGCAIERQFSSVPLPGTSDAIESEAHDLWVKAAVAFASRYNLTMYSLLLKAEKVSASESGG